jgi:hypothetical protein
MRYQDGAGGPPSCTVVVLPLDMRQWRQLLLVETNPRAAAVAWYVCVTPPAASAASVVLPPTTLLPDTAGAWARLFRPLVCASQPASGSTRRT